MNKFEKQLEKWNNGTLRGAQAKLAKLLKVSTATTALWATGKRHPSKGYVAQMAELFDTDVYSVLKLFEARPVLYPDPIPSTHTHMLCEKDTFPPYAGISFDEETPTKSNSVRIPFLTEIPLKFPFYPEYAVVEWWSVPRRYAMGAKYIISSAQAGFDAPDPDDLCFIKPTGQKEEGGLILLKNKKGDFLQCAPDALSTPPFNKAQIIGIIVRRVQGVK